MYKAVPFVLLLSGCTTIGGWLYPDARTNAAIYGVPDAVVVTRPPELYTRAEIDAINADMMCRTLARNPVQIQRCGVRR
jgi:hypothetical protein